MRVIFSSKEEKAVYRCRVCGYIYDPSKGDTLQRIPPGLEFIDLPDSWRCPVCKYQKKEFRLAKD